MAVMFSLIRVPSSFFGGWNGRLILKSPDFCCIHFINMLILYDWQGVIVHSSPVTMF